MARTKSLTKESLDDALGTEDISFSDWFAQKYIDVRKDNSLADMIEQKYVDVRKDNSLVDMVENGYANVLKIKRGCTIRIIHDLPPKVVPMTKLVSPIKHWPPEGEVLPPVPEVKNLMNYAV